MLYEIVLWSHYPRALRAYEEKQAIRREKEAAEEIRQVRNTYGKELFEAYCGTCHSFLGHSSGTCCWSEKYDTELPWLYRWIREGRQMYEAGDPKAVALVEAYSYHVMPEFPQLTDEDIQVILAYLNDMH